MPMPVRFSLRNAFMRASRVRTSRNERRTRARNVSDTMKMRGSTENATPSSSALSRHIAIRIPASVNTSPSIATTPAASSSFRTSTSLVTRVMSRPTGLRS